MAVTSASMPAGRYTATCEPAITPSPASAAAAAATSARSSAHVSARRLPCSSTATTASSSSATPGRGASRFSATFRRASGKKRVSRRSWPGSPSGGPTSTRSGAPGSPMMPPSSHTRRQNSAGLSIDHRWSAAYVVSAAGPPASATARRKPANRVVATRSAAGCQSRSPCCTSTVRSVLVFLSVVRRPERTRRADVGSCAWAGRSTMRARPCAGWPRTSWRLCSPPDAGSFWGSPSPPVWASVSRQATSSWLRPVPTRLR